MMGSLKTNAYTASCFHLAPNSRAFMHDMKMYILVRLICFDPIFVLLLALVTRYGHRLSSLSCLTFAYTF